MATVQEYYSNSLSSKLIMVEVSDDGLLGLVPVIMGLSIESAGIEPNLRTRSFNHLYKLNNVNDVFSEIRERVEKYRITMDDRVSVSYQDPEAVIELYDGEKIVITDYNA